MPQIVTEALSLHDLVLQVKYAACAAARAFMVALGPQAQRWDAQMLPRLCYNRHDAAEGVRRHAQQTWQMVVGMQGPHRLATCLPQVCTLCGLLVWPAVSLTFIPHVDCCCNNVDLPQQNSCHLRLPVASIHLTAIIQSAPPVQPAPQQESSNRKMREAAAKNAVTQEQACLHR